MTLNCGAARVADWKKMADEREMTKRITTGPTAGEAARFFQETYERLAPRYGLKFVKEKDTAWLDLPEEERNLLVATFERVLRWMRTGRR